MTTNLPTELLNYLNTLPLVSQNNSREIVRSTWERLTKKYDTRVRGQAEMVARIMNAKFGIGLEADYCEKDYGEKRKH